MAISKYIKSGKKVTTKCDACGKTPLRKPDAYDNLQFSSFTSKYKILCPSCFDKWLEALGDEI